MLSAPDATHTHTHTHTPPGNTAPACRAPEMLVQETSRSRMRDTLVLLQKDRTCLALVEEMVWPQKYHATVQKVAALGSDVLVGRP